MPKRPGWWSGSIRTTATSSSSGPTWTWTACAPPESASSWTLSTARARAGLADERGTFRTTLQIFGLLTYYLAEHRGLRAPVVRTVNETSMADRLGEIYGLTVFETPVGFKYVRPKMIETGAMMGGEESGGFGFGMHLPERDGIFTDLILLDLFLRERAAGRWPASRAIA